MPKGFVVTSITSQEITLRNHLRGYSYGMYIVACKYNNRVLVVSHDLKAVLNDCTVGSKFES